MSYSIKDQLDFQLQIGGKPVQLEQNMMDYFHIVESVRLFVPMMSLRIKDINKFFTRNDVLVDGASVVVSIGLKRKKTVYSFRLFSHKAIMNNGVTTYSIFAYLDVPRYWTESTNAIVNDTASSVLQRICAASGMTYEGVTTNDQQIWIPMNRRRCEFARHVVQHSYLDNQSCCQMTVGIDKKMRVVNVGDFSKLEVKQSFSNVEAAEQSVITDFNVLNKSGFYNAVSGYKDTQIRQSLVSEDGSSKELNVRKNSKRLSVNRNITTGIDQNRVMFAPIDIGNVNINFERAKYQNERLANLFAFGLEFVTPRLVDANVLDLVNCDVSNPGASSVTALSGKYMVTSKVVYIENMNFYQKLEVFRQGQNSTKDNVSV